MGRGAGSSMRGTRVGVMFGRAIAVAILTVAGACASLGPAAQRQDELVQAIRARDFTRADALIRQHPRELSNGNALAIAIRLGDDDAVRSYAPRASLNQA